MKITEYKTVQADEINESQKSIFRLGCAVFYAQRIEFLICHSVLALKDAKLKKFTADDLFSGDPNKRRPMLGKLVLSLKSVAQFEPDLEARLDAFVKLRNRVVHKLFFEAMSQTPEKDMEIRKTIESFISECAYMDELFLGFVAHLPLSEPIDPDVRRFKESIESLKPEGQKIVDAVFRKKRKS
jgi:hypothetical protein